MNEAAQAERYLILAVEESANSLSLYDPDTGREMGSMSLSLWPHEIAVASDGRAYVSNFGVRDYDLSLGNAGNSVSVIDVAGRNESGRLFMRVGTKPYWAPHGVKLSPNEAHIFVNVERVLGTREPDLDRPGSEFTKLLKFDRNTGECVATFHIPLAEYDNRHSATDKNVAAYDVIPGTHNFVFSPHNPDELWLFSGRAGVSVFSVSLGQIIHRMLDFNGAVRSLSFGSSGTLLVSATNEVSLVDPKTRTITKKIGDFGVGQILYSSFTPDEKYILAPAVWEGQVLVINVEEKKVVNKLTTGVDPVRVVISPDKKRAYVTHGRTQWISYIDLSDLSTIAGRIPTKGGPNGIGFASWSDIPAKKPIVLAACLPFSGAHSAQGRELRLGYQYWQDRVNDAGGLTISGQPRIVEIVYADTESRTDATELRAIARDLICRSAPIAMLGAFPSAVDRWLGLEAVSRNTIFITGIGRDDELFNGSNPLAFSLAPAVSCALEGVILALKHRLSPQPRRVCVIAAHRADHVREGLATIAFALQAGFEIVAPRDATDSLVLHQESEEAFEQVLAPVQSLAPDVLLIVNDQRDGIAAVRACYAMNFYPGGIGLTCDVTNPVFKDMLGDLAKGLLGGAGWIAAAVEFAEDRFGSGTDFARGYFDEYSEVASWLAAAGSGVGVVFEKAASCGCEDPENLADNLRKLRLDSFYAPIHFDAQGRNVANRPSAVQLDRNGSNWKDTPIWPLSLAGARRPRWPL